MGAQSFEGINRDAEQIANMLDSGDPGSATEALRQASFQYEPEDFNRLVTAVEYMEQPKTGADLIIEPVNDDRVFNYSTQYSGGQHQNQSLYRGGSNGRYNISETVASIVGSDGQGGTQQADIALLRTRVDHLNAIMFEESASNVSGSVERNETIMEDGSTIADMLDNGGVSNALEGLRQKSFGNSSEFARTLFAVDNFESKNPAGTANLELTAVDTGENYFARRDRQYGRNQNRSRWNGHGRHEDRYPIDSSLISVIAQNPDASGAANQFYRADIAVISTSVAPMDATPRRK